MSNISCMSFNILACDTHKDGYESPAHRLPYVVQTIKDEMPDLIGVQEACDKKCYMKEPQCDINWCEQMLAAIPPLGYTAVAIRDQKGFLSSTQSISCGLIIYFKTDRFTLKEDGCAVYEHDTGRYYQWVKLHDNKFDREVLFTNTHFSIDPRINGSGSGLGGDGYRITEAAKIVSFWHHNCDKCDALFATGDYNSTSLSRPQQLLGSREFKSAYLIAEKSDEHATMNFAKSQYNLDYCFVNPEAQAVKEYRVIRRKFDTDATDRLAGYASDHRPIVTYCDYKTPTETEEEEQ